MNEPNLKKIAFVTPLYLPANLSGDGVVTKHMAEMLAGKGHDVSVITSNALTARYWYDPIWGKRIKKTFEIINRVKVYRLPVNCILSSLSLITNRYLHFILPDLINHQLSIISNGPYLLGLKSLLEKGHFDLIRCSPLPLYLNQQVVNLLPRLSYRPRLIITPLFHTLLPEFVNPEFNRLIKRADIIHVVSEAEKRFLLKNFPTNEHKISVIPLFSNLRQTSNRIDLYKLSVWQKRYHFKKRKIVLFVGNKGRMKGVIDTAYALNNLYRKDSRFLLVAIGNSTPAWKKAKKKVDKNCLLDLPYVTEGEKEAFFALCDLYCMPSLSESFGLTYLEAWGRKKPVIGADIPAVKELINQNRGGLLVEFGNIEQIQEAIQRLINDQKLNQELGENGYEAVKNIYNQETLEKEYLKLFLS